MEPVEVDGASNGVGSHVGEHNPVSISEEGQGVLSDNRVETIAGWPKQSRPAVSKKYSSDFAQLCQDLSELQIFKIAVILLPAVIQYKTSS